MIDPTAQRRRIRWLRSLNAHTPLTATRHTIETILEQMEADLPPEGEPSSWPALEVIDWQCRLCNSYFHNEHTCPNREAHRA